MRSVFTGHKFMERQTAWKKPSVLPERKSAVRQTYASRTARLTRGLSDPGRAHRAVLARVHRGPEEATGARSLLAHRPEGTAASGHLLYRLQPRGAWG